jgi:hypothetical protein
MRRAGSRWRGNASLRGPWWPSGCLRDDNAEATNERGIRTSPTRETNSPRLSGGGPGADIPSISMTPAAIAISGLLEMDGLRCHREKRARRSTLLKRARPGRLPRPSTPRNDTGSILPMRPFRKRDRRLMVGDPDQRIGHVPDDSRTKSGDGDDQARPRQIEQQYPYVNPPAHNTAVMPPTLPGS